MSAKSTDAGGAAVTVAVLSACAGAIHLAMAPIHAGDARREAVAFAVVGTLQLAGAAASTRSRTAAAATVALGCAAAAAWAWSRRWALPFGLGGPEEAGLVDGLTAGLELAALVAFVVPWRASARALLPLNIAAVVATVAVLAAPSTAEHGDHTHGEATAHGHDVAAGCPEEGGGDGEVGAALRFDGPRLSDEAAAALTALAADSVPLPCGATAVAHSHGAAVAEESALPPAERATFDDQWAAATAAAVTLLSPEQATAAGYVKASPQNPGVGTHWIDWTLVDAPFDPARPSMLLFDERPGGAPRLAGFSYWTRSAPGAPDGFAGPNDVWHQHAGLCFVEGWLAAEDVPTAASCAGDWLNGSDLWMLHAWVVPDRPNDAGRFAGRNEDLCPGDREPIADALTCDPAGR